MIRTRLTLLIILLVLSQLLASGFLLWTIDNASYFIDRRRLSYREVGHYFTLGSNAFQHHQLLTDIAARRVEDPAPAVRRSSDELEKSIEDVAAATKAEIELVRNRGGDSHLPEMDRMAALAEPARNLLQGSRTLADGIDAGWTPEQVTDTARTLLPLIETGVGPVIQRALEEEDEESLSADRAASQALSRLIWVAVGVTALGMLLGTVAIYFLAQRVSGPMSRLLAGVREFTLGHLHHRTGLDGRDEFAQLGQALDDMANRLEEQRNELREARNTLADTVAERTAELAQANAELRQTDDLRREFLANVSHELRTPITVIRGEADVTLRSASRPEEYREALHHIVSQAGQLTKLVDDLLLIARSGAGALRLNRQAVALTPLLADARCHAASLTSYDADITVSGDDVSADADRDRLTQLLMILLDNALRYGGPGTRVHIRVRRQDDTAEIRVSDNGPGIPPEDMDHVFERFYRGSGSGGLRPEGSGLGLNIAKAIVDAHGGQIGLESAPGRGTTVIVALPLADRIKESA